MFCDTKPSVIMLQLWYYRGERELKQNVLNKMYTSIYLICCFLIFGTLWDIFLVNYGIYSK